ncbi:MAG: hypothetical protein QUS35_12685 [bacterium]|nr:hypothetical protein [bacterium]
MKIANWILMMMLFFVCPLTAGQLEFDIESGIVASGYNDVAVPGDLGTRFSFSEDLSTDAAVFGRIRVSWMTGRHTVSLLAAPLRLESEGTFDEPVVYQESLFPAGVPVKGTYRFDSYRLTWRYAVLRGDRFDAGLGFTAKIRDAEIGLSSAGLSETKTNVGFVPILNFRFCWKPSARLHGLIEGDALAAPQGRAEDVFAGMLIAVHPKLKVKAGYRILEGGADNDEVYTFSLFHYGSIGMVWTL